MSNEFKQVDTQADQNKEKEEKNHLFFFDWFNTRKKGCFSVVLILLLAVGAGLFYLKPWETPQVPTADPPGTEQETTDVGESAADDKTEEQEPVTEKEPEQTEEPEGESEKTEEPGKEEKPEQPTQPTQPTQPGPPAHTHTWVHHDAVTHTVHHDATYKTVHHDAVTEQKYVVDSPAVYKSTWHCTCGYSCGSEAEMSEHALNASWDEVHNVSVTEDLVTPEVGHYETVIVKDAWDEAVVDQAAWDETVVDQAAYDECSGCGARK